jgi:predicted nucleic acid-binding protein
MPPVVMLDVNPIIRLLTQDHPDQSARARVLFERAGRGEFVLHVTEGVVVDVVYILASPRLYNLPRTEIAGRLERFFTLKGLRIPQKRTYQRALELWVTTPQVKDFTDTLLVAQMERLKVTTIASFDRDFDRFPQITRLEP